MQLHVELCCLAQCRLYASYLGYLAAYVEVDEPERVVQALLVEYLQGFEQLRACQPELRGVASALFPLAAAARSQLNAYAQVGFHVQLLGGAGNDFQLVELLHNDEYALAHLLCEQRQLNVALVFVSVADDERVALALYGYHGVELGLRAGLQSEVELASVGDNLLHHGLHLVHLDGIDYEVLALVVVLLGGLHEALRGLLDAVVENVGEAQQHRRGDVAQRKLVHDLAQVNLGCVLAGGNKHVSLFVDAEVGGAPAIDVVEFSRVFSCPFLHC